MGNKIKLNLTFFDGKKEVVKYKLARNVSDLYSLINSYIIPVIPMVLVDLMVREEVEKQIDLKVFTSNKASVFVDGPCGKKDVDIFLACIERLTKELVNVSNQLDAFFKRNGEWNDDLEMLTKVIDISEWIDVSDLRSISRAKMKLRHIEGLTNNSILALEELQLLCRYASSMGHQLVLCWTE